MPITGEQVSEVIGQPVLCADGEKVGDVGQVYLDDETSRPEWVTVRTGLFGTQETFVPIAQASMAGGGLTVPYTKDVIKGAPGVEAEEHLSKEEEAQLYRHYGRTRATPAPTPAFRKAAPAPARRTCTTRSRDEGPRGVTPAGPTPTRR